MRGSCWQRRARFAIPMACVALLVGACSSGDGGGQGAGEGAASDDGDEADGQPNDEVSSVVFASLEFVSAAVRGGEAEALLAPASAVVPDGAQPFDRDLVIDRLADLRSFDDAVGSVRPSETADLFDDGGEDDGGDGGGDDDGDLARTCIRSVVLSCHVDLVADRPDEGDVVASVAVEWVDDAITGFSIITRSTSGAPNGIGEARCSGDHRLVHGGHTDRFDVAICTDPSGVLEYSGAERGTPNDIRLPACEAEPGRWEANNEGTVYVVDATVTPSLLQVLDPLGREIATGTFVPVHLGSAATPSFC